MTSSRDITESIENLTNYGDDAASAEIAATLAALAELNDAMVNLMSKDVLADKWVRLRTCVEAIKFSIKFESVRCFTAVDQFFADRDRLDTLEALLKKPMPLHERGRLSRFIRIDHDPHRQEDFGFHTWYLAEEGMVYGGKSLREAIDNARADNARKS